MRNVISIDVINSCSCNAIAITDTKTNEIIIEVITGDANSPRLELIRYAEVSKSIALDANASNLVVLEESDWVLSGYSQFRYVDQERTGELFTVYFPATINDIYVNMTSDTAFTVVSKSSSGGGGGTGGNVNVVDNLTSMSTTDALSANQGRVLKESLDVTKNVVSGLSGEVSNNSSDISTLQSKVSGNSSSISVLSAYVNEVSIQVGTTASDVKNLKESNQNIVNKLANHTTDIGDLFELTDSLDNRTDTNEADISELQSKVGEGLSVEVGTVTTAEAGTEASVTNTGTDTHAVLDFVIPKGDAGKNGVSVSSVAQTTTSTADGGTNVVTVTLSNGTKSTFNVKNGSKGSTGNGIKSTAVTYQASTSGTTVPTGTWSTAIPTVTAGNYLWTRVIFTYTDGTTATAYGVAKHGADGKDGSDANVSFTQALTSGTKIGTLTLDGKTIDLYAPTNTDTHVQQVNTSYDKDYRVLLSTNDNDNTETNAIRKSTNFKANPSTGAFYAKGYDRIDITGQTLDLDTLTLSAGSPEIMRYVEKTDGGASNITNIPVTGRPFILDVELVRWASTTDYITKQTFSSSAQPNNDYVRWCNKGTWGAWTKRVYTDNNTTYGVATTSANGLMSSADKSKIDETNIAYGTCSTAGATSAKEVTIDGNSNWALKKGAIVTVKFTNTNTASNVTLNVNGTGAKQIYWNNAVYTGNSSTTGGYANRYITYMYDGTYWVWIGHSIDNNTTYTNASLGQGYGTCATAEATTAKVVTLSSYALTVGGIVSVKFTYAVPASATMNINSKGAKAIYHRGSAIKAGVIKAGDIATFIYDGTQYHLLAIDRTTTGTLTTSDVVDNLTSTSTTAPLSAKQGKVINDKVNNLKEHAYSLVIDHNVDSTTDVTVTTYSSRKFSDYDIITFTLATSTKSIQDAITIPRALYEQGYTVYLNAWDGSTAMSGKIHNKISVVRVSDTQIKVRAVNTISGTLTLNVYGFKIIDKSTL